jgi:hypothetical protein
MALLSFVESAPRAYRLKASNAASPISTSSGTIPYSDRDRAQMKKGMRSYSQFAANHYLNRLFLQIKAAREANAFAIVSEEDIQILGEIGKYSLSQKLPTPFDIPDMQGRLIEPDSFCDGLLNFTPPDIKAVAAVKSDPTIREYGAKNGSLLAESDAREREQKILAAMVEAHKKCEAGAQAKKIFEVGSWVVKPLHYVPIVGEIVGAAEDLKDVAAKWAQREVLKQEWCLLGVKMADIAINNYLNRKANLIAAN